MNTNISNDAPESLSQTEEHSQSPLRTVCDRILSGDATALDALKCDHPKEYELFWNTVFDQAENLKKLLRRLPE